MAKGKEVGRFAHKWTSITLLPGPAGSTLSQANVEGTATGYGTVHGTATFVGGKSGTYSANWAAFLDNGDQLSGTSNGSYESVGTHVWATKEIVNVSDGTHVYSEGKIDLAKHSWIGELFDWE
jgi:hypothetical protein